MTEFLSSFLSDMAMKVMPTLPGEAWQTIYAAVGATVFAYVIGMPVGIILVTGEKGGIRPLPGVLMKVLNFIVNTLRSIPFLILMIMALPLSMIVFGTTIGTIASLIPLVIAAFPFVARMVESSLREVDKGVIEAAQAMGCSPWQIVKKVMLPECRPSLISGATIALTTILAYGAMAGAIGGGGLGKVAIDYGYYRTKPDVMYICVILLIILVQVFQSVGTWLAVRLDKRITSNKNKKGRL